MVSVMNGVQNPMVYVRNNEGSSDNSNMMPPPSHSMMSFQPGNSFSLYLAPFTPFPLSLSLSLVLSFPLILFLTTISVNEIPFINVTTLRSRVLCCYNKYLNSGNIPV